MDEQLKQLQTSIRQLGTWRLAMAMLALILLFRKKLIFLVFVLIFIMLAFRQAHFKEKYNYLKAKKALLEKIALRQDERWMAEKAIEMPDAPHYLYDLDVFGKAGLATFLNFTATESAKTALVKRLSTPLKPEEICKTQVAIKELSEHEVSLDELIGQSLLGKKEQKEYHKEDFQAIKPLPAYLRGGIYLYPLIWLMPMILWQLKGLVFGILAGLFFTYCHFPLWQKAFEMMQKRVDGQKACKKLAPPIIQAHFESDLLKRKQDEIKRLYEKSSYLESMNQLLKCRYNPFLHFVLEGVVCYEGWVYLWLEKQGDMSCELQDALGDFGALCSLAQWLRIKKDTVFPTFSQHLAAFDIKHPLINHAVGASFSFDHDAVIITGSNMSGKTTFMRSIGLNLVLFYCGLSVEATSFEAPYLKIYTSMRVADRMQEGISTFYGELLRIKEMVSAAKQNEAAIFLIDEIFKGTNLKERIMGAKAVIEKLHYEQSFLFVSTHDEQLTHHEHLTLTNIHFEEYYQDDKVYFDYLLKNGSASTGNAAFLMKMTGIIE